MNEQDFDGPTPAQAAILRYLDLPSDDSVTRTQATALIAHSEADPAQRERLQAWHREKHRLHPDLFNPPARSVREARWWQSRITDGGAYGDSFEPPTLEQTLGVLAALDQQEPGWEREARNRREARFMNELAALLPELSKPGGVYPQALPSEGAPDAPTPRAPSAPFVPGTAAPGYTPTAILSKPAWTPAEPSPPPFRPEESASPARRGGGSGAMLLLVLLAVLGVGVAGYLWSHREEPEHAARVTAPVVTPPPVAANKPAGSPTPAGPYAPLPATESRQRAMAKHPELAQAGSPLNAKFLAAYHLLESQHSPRLLQPDWPERLADEFAGNFTPPPAAPEIVALSPPPPVPKAPATPAPAASKAPPSVAPPVGSKVVAVSTPALSAPPTAAPKTSAAPSATPGKRLFVTLDAVNKSRVNNYTYHWSSYYWADYDISFRQTVGIEAKVRNMTQTPAVVTLRWMFFGRKSGNNERYVFSASQKRLELAPGQTTEEVLDSPMLESRAAVDYNYGMRYYSGSKYEGWLVQVLPENGDEILKQVGSSGYIEDFGKRPDLPTLLKQQLAH